MMKHRWIEVAAHVVISATFFVPLILISSSFIFPFIVPKIVVFRGLVQILLGVYVLLLFASWKSYEPKRTGISLAVAGFFLSFTLSTFIGVDWYHSFWDNHERMLGLFTMFHYGLFYIVLTSVIRHERSWNSLCKIFLLSGTIVVALAGIQRIDPTFLLNQGGDRVSSTLGNPIYLGGYGLFLCFCGMLLFVRSGKNMWRYVGIAGVLVGVLGIIFSKTRGSFLGLVAGVIVASAVYVVSRWKERQVRVYASVGVAVCAVAVMSIWFFRHTDFVQRVPIVGSLVNTSISAGTGGTRLIAWKVAIESWKERPFFGWGPNNFFYAFNKYYNPASLRYGWGETWFDNAHNILLNTLAVQGLVGIVSYLSLFVAVWVTVFRRYRDGVLSLSSAALFAGFFTAHFIHNFFVFENPTSLLYFFFMLAFVNSTARSKLFSQTASPASVGVAREVPALPVLLVVVCASFFVFVTNVSPARANMATLTMLQRVYSGQQPLQAFEAVEHIPSPHIDDIRSDFARVVVETVPDYVKAGRKEEAWLLVQRAYLELQKNRVLHPLDIRANLQLSDIAQLAFGQFQKQDYMIEAANALVDALDKSPKRQQIIYQLIAFQLGFGKSQQAIDLLTKSIADAPEVGEGWWRLAVVYQQLGDITMAKKVVADARASGVTFDERGLQVINSILALPDPTSTKNTKK